MRRPIPRRLLGATGGTLALLAATLAVAVPTASADPLLDQKQARYKAVEAEGQTLDPRRPLLHRAPAHAARARPPVRASREGHDRAPQGRDPARARAPTRARTRARPGGEAPAGRQQGRPVSARVGRAQGREEPPAAV